MRFTPEFLDELRARLPVSEVVQKRVKLKKAGREWKGLSPFQQEKTPSFFVNDQKQAWFDFSSGRNGNIFSFLMETEGCSFVEAVERCAQMAGMDLPKVSAVFLPLRIGRDFRQIHAGHLRAALDRLDEGTAFRLHQEREDVAVAA